MNYQDKSLTCQECGRSFVFSADDQAYHALKGYTNEPKRCSDCRAARRNASGSFGSNSRSQREMHTVVCAQCGQDAMVPFLPRGDRPVYCSDCFNKQSAVSSRY